KGGCSEDRAQGRQTSGPSSFPLSGCGKHDDKAAPGTGPRLDANRPTMPLDDLLHDCEPNAASGLSSLLGRGHSHGGTAEELEYLLVEPLWYAEAIVMHPYDDPVPVLLTDDSDLASSLRHVLHRVVDQVLEHTAQLGRPSAHCGK